MREAVGPAARVARFLVVATVTAKPPNLSRDRTPATCFRLLDNSDYVVLGDGVNQVTVSTVDAVARRMRDACDRVGTLWWVWVGHDQFLYRTEWAFFLCHGPPGWVAPHIAASIGSAEALRKLEADKKCAERAAAEIVRKKNADARKGKKSQKKTPRNMDAIIEQVEASQKN